MNTKKHFWEGSVGIELEPQKTRQGIYFWTFRFERMFKAEGAPTFEYAETFTVHNIEALGKVMAKAIQFINTTRPEDYLQKAFDRNAA